MYFKDWNKITKVKTEGKFKLLLRSRTENKAAPLPPRFSDDVQYVVRAYRLQLEPGSLLDSPRQYSGEKKESRKLYEGSWDYLIVYQIPGAGVLVEEAEKAGEFAVSGETAFGKPVYLIEGRKDPRHDYLRRFYFLITDTDEILLANSMKMLKKMVATGMGFELGFLEDPDYVDFVGLVPMLDECWNVSFSITGTRLVLNFYVRRKTDPEKIDAAKEFYETSPIYQIESYHADDDFIYKKEYAYYTDPTYARDALPKLALGKVIIPPGAPQAELDYYSILYQGRKISVDGCMKVAETRYDEEKLEKMDKEWKAAIEFYLKKMEADKKAQ